MKHIDQGTIQAFLDGELADAALERVSAHLATCATCAAALVEAESETTALMQAFAAENSFAVPTQRIWARIENEIETLDTAAARGKFVQPSLWQQLSGAFSLAFVTRFATPATAATALAVIVAFTLFSFNFNRQQLPQNEVARSNTQPIQNPDSVTTVATNANSGTNDTRTPIYTAPLVVEREPVRSLRDYQSEKAAFRAAAPRVVRTVTRSRTSADVVQPSRDLNTPLTEERAYLDAIDDLSRTVAASDEAVMRPSFQVEYKQNMAMMDGAISKMQRQVRRNPTDENAKRILFASYQNKIDLLNTVAEKSQLMVALR